MNRALILDCDGVLADSERDGHRVAFNQMFAELGLPLFWDVETYGPLLRIAGGKERMASVLTPAMLAELGVTDLPAALAAWHGRKTEIFADLVGAGHLPPRPGVKRLISEAIEAGWRVGVASTSNPVSVNAILLSVVGPELARSVKVYAGDIVPNKKPAPDVYQLALADLRVAPSDAVVIEDSGIGCAAAGAAGIATVITVATYTAAEDFTGAGLVVSDLGTPGGPARLVANPAGVRFDGMVDLGVLEEVRRRPEPGRTNVGPGVGHGDCLRDEAHRLLDVALASVCDEGGFGWLNGRGKLDRKPGRPLWITARMTHVAAIGTLLDHPGCQAALDHGVEALGGVFRDGEYGGWYTALGPDNQPTDDTKAAYPTSFVILALASAVAAGSEAAVPLLREALTLSSSRFWDSSYEMVTEQWDRTFTKQDAYRGVNANMHTVEAYLAAADTLELTLGDPTAGLWRERALAITDRVVNREARAHDWRIPEHFDEGWNAQLDYNRERPADPFRPYGATIGHGLEWARLTLQLQAALGGRPDWARAAAKALYDRAVADGWNADGSVGFVYTTDWTGQVVVGQRMHWVVAEAIGAAAALDKAGVGDMSGPLRMWWWYADSYLISPPGSWRHELDTKNRPSHTVWRGRPDVYHAIQACLFELLPLTPALVPALRDARIN